jgi:hypothetical protein
MTRQQIQTMSRGSYIDRFIAELIYGYQFLEIGYYHPGGNGVSDTSTPELQMKLKDWLDKPEVVAQYDNAVGDYMVHVKKDRIFEVSALDYSHNISLALKLAERICHKACCTINVSGSKGNYLVQFQGIDYVKQGGILGAQQAQWLPLAICKAVLDVTLSDYWIGLYPKKNGWHFNNS